MELSLTAFEAQVLRETVETAFNELLLEIARADKRKARETLKAREEILKTLLDKLPASTQAVA